MAEIIQFDRARSTGSADGRDREELALDGILSGISIIDSARRLLQALRVQRVPELELPPKTHPDPEDRARARRDMLATPAPPGGLPIPQDVRAAMRHRWDVQWARLQAAKHWHRAASLDTNWKDDRPDAGDRAAQRDQALAAYQEECLILMMVPAWSKEALAWKHKHTDYLDEKRDQWGPVLAADEARLIARGKSPARLAVAAS